MRASQRSAVAPFQVMSILDRVAHLRAAGRDVISLCAGEPSGGAPRAVRELAASTHAGGHALGYTSALGLHELREAIAVHYRRWYGLEVPPQQVAVTTGSSGAFMLTFLAAFDPGDVVVLARPGYPAYRNILQTLGCRVVEVDCDAQVGFQPTPEMLDGVLATHGRVAGLVIASPANPTGTMIDRDRMTALAAWCTEHDVRLVSDEIYHGITYPADPAAPDARGVCAWDVPGAQSAVVVSSFSKYWGMTGWRLGWALLPADLAGAVDALAGNVALCPPAPAQYAALGAFSEETYAEADARVADLAATRTVLLDDVPRLGWGPIAPADGAFYLYAGLAERLGGYASSVQWCAALLEQEGVAVVPGVDFDGARGREYVRLSFAAGADAVREAVRRIERFQGT
ncbi:aminotransferase class I/II-fold pyridoxal phosphate-dependent enzyme [Georgenia satyanarayanai]|uniref:pyridoxal phosphate-dependent aminotransferase n=1 Tax=Georgenia satyanarayanai TaxID=860221 RepID=UPI00203B77D4|nr:aminotransferase class I/II-fold pyridoxal phosphate-dependent enzyme [Georgenia satyanarayanai]MCM3662194.1 aminotransferase class I/II-fold pyridoxal phosphate-dependent enzyme [Georgenia satyanarayanai]